MIKEDYCSFEISKLLKEKGFDVPCRAYWDNQPSLNIRALFWTVEPYHYNREVNAPTHQMAMKWLREEYDIIICIDYNEDEECEERWGFSTYQNNVRKVDFDLVTYVTYEDAVEAALKYCLTELI